MNQYFAVLCTECVIRFECPPERQLGAAEKGRVCEGCDHTGRMTRKFRFNCPFELIRGETENREE